MIPIASETDMLAFASKLAEQVTAPCVIFLCGDLGAGKTTLTRGFLRGLGYQHRVKSPSFTLVEPYDLGDTQVYHFDFYRLMDAEELELIGWRDYFTEDAICLIEWPEKAGELLPAADILCEIHIQGQQRELLISSPNHHADAIIARL